MVDLMTLNVVRRRLRARNRPTYRPVASLGWVTPGADLRVSPLYFFLKKLATFLVITVSASSAVSPLFIFSWKTDDLFCSSLSLFIDFTRMSLSPLEGVTPHLFTCPTSFLHYFL